MAAYIQSSSASAPEMFENDVKMYGTQTRIAVLDDRVMFENDVKMYGTQTRKAVNTDSEQFENDVKMYGTQTVAFVVPTEQLFENDVKMYGTQTCLLYTSDAADDQSRAASDVYKRQVLKLCRMITKHDVCLRMM